MKDGLQGLSHDRILMRLVNYTQIGLAVGGAWWGATKVAISIARLTDQVTLLQQQMSSMQQLVVSQPHKQHESK